MKIAEAPNEKIGGGAKYGRKIEKARPLPQDVAPAGAFIFQQPPAKKVELLFYFCGFGQKKEDFGKKGRFFLKK